ncbi:MAG: M23 family metallopeptidase [Terriglobia bacterium]
MSTRSQTGRVGLRVAGLLFFLLLPAPAQAQESESCRRGLELRLSSQTPAQGSLVLVEVKSKSPLADLSGEGFGQTLRFWPAGNPGHSYRALLGVDLERPAATFPLSINAELESGQRVACSLLATVREGDFALERLRVDSRYTELDPKDLERARREGRRLREIYASVAPERLWEGAFRPPLAGVEASGNFGRRRILNDEPRSPHSGEDYPAPAGTPVRAPQRARVALADNLFFSGNTVVLDHGLGLYTFYAHLESLAVKEGAVVETGDLLGRVGATGRVTGAHLHWGARLNRARINPRDLLVLLSD